MFDEEGRSHYGTCSARGKQAGNRYDQMDEKEQQVGHDLDRLPNARWFGSLGIFGDFGYQLPIRHTQVSGPQGGR